MGSIRDCFNNLTPKINFLCLQEHKLRGDKVSGCCGKQDKFMVHRSYNTVVLIMMQRIGDKALGEAALLCASTLDYNH